MANRVICMIEVKRKTEQDFLPMDFAFSEVTARDRAKPWLEQPENYDIRFVYYELVPVEGRRRTCLAIV